MCKNKKSLLKEFFKNVFFSLAILITVFFFIKENFVYNLTPSIPKGIYKREKNEKNFKKGDTVIFNISQKDRKFMIERGYISNRTKYLIKNIAGVEGDTIEVSDYLYINGNKIKPLPEIDTLGRDLKKIEGKYVLKEGEYFMLGENPRSYDSSYLGIINDSQFIEKANIFLKFE